MLVVKRSALTAKKPLTAKTPIKKGAGKKQAKPSITKLKKEATKLFNRAVKYRDSEFVDGTWIFKCITCNRPVVFKDAEGKFNKNAQAGHFMPETYSSTKYEEENVNGQCGMPCNYNQGEQVKYARALDLKYGDGTAKKLEKMAGHKQWTVPELQQIIDDAKAEIDFYEQLEVT